MFQPGGVVEVDNLRVGTDQQHAVVDFIQHPRQALTQFTGGGVGGGCGGAALGPGVAAKTRCVFNFGRAQGEILEHGVPLGGGGACPWLGMA